MRFLPTLEQTAATLRNIKEERPPIETGNIHLDRWSGRYIGMDEFMSLPCIVGRRAIKQASTVGAGYARRPVKRLTVQQAAIRPYEYLNSIIDMGQI